MPFASKFKISIVHSFIAWTIFRGVTITWYHVHVHTHAGREPRIPELWLLENVTKGIKVKIIEKVQADWVMLSDLLELPDATVSNVMAHPGWTPSNASRTIFVKWLNGQGIKPKSWGTLIRVFRSMGYRKLADDISLILE